MVGRDLARISGGGGNGVRTGGLATLHAHRSSPGIREIPSSAGSKDSTSLGPAERRPSSQTGGGQKAGGASADPIIRPGAATATENQYNEWTVPGFPVPEWLMAGCFPAHLLVESAQRTTALSSAAVPLYFFDQPRTPAFTPARCICKGQLRRSFATVGSVLSKPVTGGRFSFTAAAFGGSTFTTSARATPSNLTWNKVQKVRKPQTYGLN